MTKKLFLTAFALPLFFTACNNEFEEISPEKQDSQNEIVGEKLVEGLTLSVNRTSDVNSRLNSAGWENGDQVGLAWYNIGQTIAGVQVGQSFSWNSINSEDQNVYGNHKFIANEGSFETQANVYEGAHFAYYPYTYMKQAGVLTFEPNAAVQTKDFYADMFANALHISAQDTILASSVKDGKVVKTFDLVRMVNTLKFQLASKELANTEYMSALPITGVELSVMESGKNALFNTRATITPYKLPYAVYDDKNDDDEDGIIGYDAVETKAQLYEAEVFGENAAIALSEAKKQVSTTVNNPSYTLAKAQSDVRMFLLPTNAQETLIPAGAIAVRVYVPGGVFTIKNEAKAENTTETNQATLKDLREILSTGFKSGERTFKMSKLGNQATEAKDLNALIKTLNFDLIKANFTADFSNIKTLAEWNGAVTIANELGLENPTFVVKKAINFTEGKINTPADGVTVKTENGGKLVVDSDMTWPANLTAKVSVSTTSEGTTTTTEQYAEVEVTEGRTLTIDDEKSLADANVTNKGIIKVGAKATLANVNNAVGRIEVVYGSYVTLKEGTESGIVAYEVAADEAMYKINNLIAAETSGTQNKIASVNTLVVNEGITLNLSKVDGSSSTEDPYTGTNTTGGVFLSKEKIEGINIELNGGILTATVNSGWKVADVTVCEGTANAITNVDITGDLIVAANAETVINTDKNALGTKNAVLVYGEVKNEGTLTIKTDVYCNIVVNKGTLTTNTTGNYAYMWWMEDSQIQNSNVSGTVNRYYGKIVKNTNDIDNQYNEYILAVDAKIPAEVGKDGNVEIIGNGRKLDMPQTKDGRYQYRVGAINGKKLSVKNAYLTTTTNANNGKTYYYHVYFFTSDVNLQNVESDKGIMVAGETNLNTVKLNETTCGTYALWILAYGQEVNVEDCTFYGVTKASDTYGRGIKIWDDNNHTSVLTGFTKGKVTLNVKKSTFETEKKAAVLSTAGSYGAKIVWGEGNDISKVAGDKTNAVWVDEFDKAFYDNVVVTGCTKIQEK